MRQRTSLAHDSGAETQSVVIEREERSIATCGLKGHCMCHPQIGSPGHVLEGLSTVMPELTMAGAYNGVCSYSDPDGHLPSWRFDRVGRMRNWRCKSSTRRRRLHSQPPEAKLQCGAGGRSLHDSTRSRSALTWHGRASAGCLTGVSLSGHRGDECHATVCGTDD